MIRPGSYRDGRGYPPMRFLRNEPKKLFGINKTSRNEPKNNAQNAQSRTQDVL